MNFIKRFLVQRKARKKFHKMSLSMIKTHGDNVNLEFLQRIEDDFVNAEVNLIEMSDYPIYERFIDGIRLGYFTWKQQRKGVLE